MYQTEIFYPFIEPFLKVKLKNSGALSILQDLTTARSEKKFKDSLGRARYEIAASQSPTYQMLFTDVSSLATNLIQQLGITDRSLQITEAWGNCLEKSEQIRPHTHPHFFLSAVYYPEQSSKLVFRRPNVNVVSNHMPHNLKGNPFTNHWFEFSPEENDLILFPSWIEHYTEANSLEKPRFSVAFNLKLL